MSNASLKDQLEAAAAQLSISLSKVSVTERVKEPSRDRVKDRSKENAQTKPKKEFVKKPIVKVTAPPAPKKPKPKWLDYVQYGVALLKTNFPLCFKANHEVKPLKKGIKIDLIQRLSTMDTIVTEDKACMVKSLSYYVNTMSYHKKVVEQAPRIDLDGQPAGVVTALEAKYSEDKQLAKLNAKKQAVTSTKVPTERMEETI